MFNSWNDPSPGEIYDFQFNMSNVFNFDSVEYMIDWLPHGWYLAGIGPGMPGCKSYIVATEPTDPNAIWITEVWDNKESHAASLQLPAVKQVIAAARPLIAGFSNRVETVPVGQAAAAKP